MSGFFFFQERVSIYFIVAVICVCVFVMFVVALRVRFVFYGAWHATTIETRLCVKYRFVVPCLRQARNEWCTCLQYGVWETGVLERGGRPFNSSSVFVAVLRRDICVRCDIGVRVLLAS